MSTFLAVDMINNQELAQISLPMYQYCCKDFNEKSNSHFSAVPKDLSLKVGAQVLLIKNMNKALVNGSRGVVVRFELVNFSAFPVATEQDRKVKSTLLKFFAPIKQSRPVQLPVVSFYNNMEVCKWRGPTLNRSFQTIPFVCSLRGAMANHRFLSHLRSGSTTISVGS